MNIKTRANTVRRLYKSSYYGGSQYEFIKDDVYYFRSEKLSIRLPLSELEGEEIVLSSYPLGPYKVDLFSKEIEALSAIPYLPATLPTTKELRAEKNRRLKSHTFAQWNEFFVLPLVIAARVLGYEGTEDPQTGWSISADGSRLKLTAGGGYAIIGK